jgi:hypothetical protein
VRWWRRVCVFLGGVMIGSQLHWVTVCYVGCNALRLVAYGPQIWKLVRGGSAEGVSVASWSIFAATHASTCLYAWEVQRDVTLGWATLGNLVACLVIAGLAAWRQLQARAASDDGGLGCPAGRGRQRDATFLDAVTGHPGRAVRRHLGSLGLASRIRIRTPRVKGTA